MLIKQNHNVRPLLKFMLLWMLVFMVFNVLWSCTAHAADVAIKKDGISQIWSEAGDSPGSYRMQEVKLDNLVINWNGLANAAANATIVSPFFDLGPNWKQYTRMVVQGVMVGSNSGGGAICWGI